MNKIEAVKKIQEFLKIEDRFINLEISGENLLKLHQLDLLDNFLDDCQNDSPSVGTMLLIARTFPKKSSFYCYVVNTDREDTRLSIEGYVISDIGHYDAIELMRQHTCADEIDYSNNNLRMWWD